MAYNHGIQILEDPTGLAAPVNGTAGLQVIWGTAPVNLALDPYNVANKLIIAFSFAEAVEQLGYSDDFKKYTLCQSMDVCFRVFNIAPIILCNVLDPKKHKKKNELQTVMVTDKQATVAIEGILLDTVTVKTETGTLTNDVDYVLSFDDSGHALITLLDDGAGASAAALMVESTSIDPDAVTKNDIIGGYDVSTGKETGLELVRQVYPKFTMTPGLLLAPGWSQDANVGAVLAAKCTGVNGLFTCECVIDLDSSENGATKYTDCNEVAIKSGFVNKHAIVVWPQVIIGDKQYVYSAVFAALTAYTDAMNGDIPNLSPSNKMIGVSGSVLADGTEMNLDQQQANLLNSQGITTLINFGGWKTWGNNTVCYPGNTDAKDRWICCRRFFSWWGNSFILTYASKVDNPANSVLIESICDSENIKGNSLANQGKCAGARIEFNPDENPITDILNGKIQFRQYLAPYVPAEHILNVLEFDPSMIKEALGG